MPRFTPAGHQPAAKPVNHAPLQKTADTKSQLLPAIRGLSVQRTVIDGGLLNEALTWAAGTVVTITVSGNTATEDVDA